MVTVTLPRKDRLFLVHSDHTHNRKTSFAPRSHEKHQVKERVVQKLPKSQLLPKINEDHSHASALNVSSNLSRPRMKVTQRDLKRVDCSSGLRKFLHDAKLTLSGCSKRVEKELTVEVFAPSRRPSFLESDKLKRNSMSSIESSERLIANSETREDGYNEQIASSSGTLLSEARCNSMKRSSKDTIPAVPQVETLDKNHVLPPAAPTRKSVRSLTRFQRQSKMARQREVIDGFALMEKAVIHRSAGRDQQWNQSKRKELIHSGYAGYESLLDENFSCPEQGNSKEESTPVKNAEAVHGESPSEEPISFNFKLSRIDALNEIPSVTEKKRGSNLPSPNWELFTSTLQGKPSLADQYFKLKSRIEEEDFDLPNDYDSVKDYYYGPCPYESDHCSHMFRFEELKMNPEHRVHSQDDNEEMTESDLKSLKTISHSGVYGLGPSPTYAETDERSDTAKEREKQEHKSSLNTRNAENEKREINMKFSATLYRACVALDSDSDGILSKEELGLALHIAVGDLGFEYSKEQMLKLREQLWKSRSTSRGFAF